MKNVIDRRALLRLMSGSALGSLVPTLSGCRKHSDKIVVGFAQMVNTDPWRRAETLSMRTEAEKRGVYELVVTDAQNQTAKQVADVEDLVARRVKAIFLAPLEHEGLEPALEVARRFEVPVFLIDRAARGEPGVDYVSFLGSDFVEQGRRAARWLAQARPEGARIVELSGTSGSSVAADRAAGFREELARHPNLRIVASQAADFSRVLALRVMSNIAQSHGSEVDAVYAHNDEMALGAIAALEAAGRKPGKDVTIVSIDGQRGALEAILRGELGATVESNPRFGPLAFDALEKHLAGESVPPQIILEDRLFDATNASAFLDEAY